MQDKYTLDGIWLLKNGQISICPVNPGVLKPDESSINMGKPKLNVDYMPCNTQCPFFNKATLENKESKEKKEGYLLKCGGKNTFLPIES